jgi:hypothetical protein
MKALRRLNRRSFLAQVAGTAVAGGAIAVPGGDAKAGQVTDSDPSDPVGRGRGGGTGFTDRDPTDAVGRGRGNSQVTDNNRVTDSDPTDPAGGGRGRSGSGGVTTDNRVTDSDPTDPIGGGRGSPPRPDTQPPDYPRMGRRPPRDDYVDCVRERENLELAEERLRQASWGADELENARAGLARMREGIAEMDRLRREDAWFRDSRTYSWQEEITSIGNAHGLNCQLGQEEECIRRMQDAIALAERSASDRAMLEWQVNSHRERLARGGC